jgi:hypothetical protein
MGTPMTLGPYTLAYKNILSVTPILYCMHGYYFFYFTDIGYSLQNTIFFIRYRIIPSPMNLTENGDYTNSFSFYIYMFICLFGAYLVTHKDERFTPNLSRNCSTYRLECTKKQGNLGDERIVVNNKQSIQTAEH